MSGGIKVSLCVIARDEEECIRQCLQSARHIVDESIVVDTGSSDRTTAIAEEEGAKVYAFAWGDDFAAARNFALEQASGDWVLVLDADEVLEYVGKEEVGRLVAVPGVEGYYLRIRSFLGNGENLYEDNAVRFFRRKNSYRFTGAIHEQVSGSILSANEGGGLAFSGLVISHFGYLDRRILLKSKRSRNIGIIKQGLAAAPQDPLLLYCLGIEYLQDGQSLSAVSELGEALRRLHGDEGYCRDVVLAYGISLYKAGQVQELEELADKYLRVMPDDGDFSILKGMGALAAGRYPEGAVAIETALDKGGELLPRSWLYMLLADAWNLSGDYGRAGRKYLEALRENPNVLYPLFQLLGLRQKGLVMVDWLLLSRLGLPEILVTEQGEQGSKEFAVRLVLTLLAMLARCGQGQYERLPESLLEKSGMRVKRNAGGVVIEYLNLCLEEAEVYSKAVAFGCCEWFQPEQAIKDLIVAGLETVVAALCPDWSPEPDFCLKGIHPRC